MLSRFFLDRPVFAWVIAIIMMAGGGLAIYNLPIAQYPPIAPPSIAITAFYPGASAETVENSVTQIIEQKMTGFDRMLYLTATSDSSGSCRIELVFAPGTDPDLAWAQVQNKLQLAMANLPEVVGNQGVRVSKSTRNYLMFVGLISEDGSMDGNDLRDYAQSNLEKVLSRVPGVGEVEIFGSQYAMRVWLNPDKLTNYGMTVQDVIASLRAYNVEVSAGQFGGAPAVKGQRLNASIIVQSLLKTPEEFAAIPLRTNPDGSVVRVRDVGRTELGTETYDVQAYYNGKPAAGMAIRQAAGANALQTADNVKAKMGELSNFFPPGMKVIFPYDTTPFVRVAINEVFKTLLEAIGLVFLVMYLFMGNMRATLIPTIAVPVVILGTFAVLGVFGFSINMLTMFAMVLAIGLLVDDAIVVVENVERIMSEEGLSPREATAKSMDQITSALIGIGLVLSAVFGPMAFFPGSTGVIYRQFSVTVITSMLLSVLVALILTPVLCATLLKPVPKGHEPAENAVWFLRPFFRWFEHRFFRTRELYMGLVSRSISNKRRYLAVFIVILAAMGFLFLRMPTAYLPDEDQGIHDGAGPAAGELDPGADRRGPEAGPHLFPRERERHGRSRVHRFRHQLFGPGAERGVFLHQAQGLGSARRAKPEGRRRRRARHGGILENPQCHGVCLRAAGGRGTGAGQGVRFPAAGPGRPGTRQTDGSPQQAPRHGRRGPRPDEGPAQRPGGCARIPDRRGLGEGRRPGRAHQLRSTTRSRRPSGAPTSTTSSRQAVSSASTSRPTLPTACCLRISSGSTCETPRAKWSPSPPLPRATGRPGPRSWSDSTASRPSTSWARRRREGAPARR